MNIGLVLSGGMAKGAYEVGALKAISEYFRPEQIKYISASSIGVANAYAFSCGRLDDAFTMWRKINEKYPKLFLKTVLDSDYFNEAMEEISSSTPLCEKFYASLLDVNQRCHCYVNLLRIKQELRSLYLKAAMAFVPLVKPVSINGHKYVDGAFADNIPVFPLIKHSLDYIICVHFDKYDYTFESSVFDERIIKIVFNEDKELITKSIWLTRDGVEQMMKDGYEKAKRILDCVLSNGVENTESIYERIRFLNSLRPENQVRLSGDIVFDNITKFTRRLAKLKIYN